MNDLVNQLTTATTALANCETKDIAPQIMAMCRTITPQFYKGLSDVDIQTEKTGIELLLSGIERDCLVEMCRLAVLNYPLARSENEKQYFDINYILRFYKTAFNNINSKNIQIPDNAQYVRGAYDPQTHVVTEEYATDDGQKFVVRELVEPPLKNEQTIYSTKYFKIFEKQLEKIFDDEAASY